MTFLVDTTPENPGPRQDARVTPLGKVVRRAEHLALLDAQGLVDRARADAARIVEQAWDAYRMERERGHAEGLQAARTEQAAALMQIAQQTSAYLKDVERDIVDVVVASVRRIVGDFDPSERVLAVVRGGLASLRRQKNVLLRVHTDDAVFVRQHMQALLSEFPSVDYVDVVADDRFPRGACRIETPIGTIETSLDKQLDVLQNAFERVLPAVEAANPESRQEHDEL